MPMHRRGVVSRRFIYKIHIFRELLTGSALSTSHKQPLQHHKLETRLYFQPRIPKQTELWKCTTCDTSLVQEKQTGHN